MTFFRTTGLIAALLGAIGHTGEAAAQTYAADVPETILTPDAVETQTLGTLKFFDGMPQPETTAKLYDRLDLVRGITAFLDGVPVASLYAFNKGLREEGVATNDVGIWENLADARTLLLTPNTTTIYVASPLDVSEGPVVIEVPPGMLGILDDAAFKFVENIGFLGPDKGEGGKYLFLPPGYKGDVPQGYFVINTPSYEHWFILRGSPDENGETEAAVAAIKEGLNIYSLSEADNPPEEIFTNLSGVQINTIHANDFAFFEEIDAAVQHEPEGSISPELLGTFAAIGIRKGEPFEPDDRLRAILEEAAAIGNGIARAVTFSPRDPGVFFYEGQQWSSPYRRKTSEFLVDGVRMLDDRTYFHYYATGITPAMADPPVGSGSVYAIAAKDATGAYLDGGKTYSVTLPGPVPAKRFWSFQVYSGQHRSLLETDQQSAGIDSNAESLAANEDGSYTVYFGPKAPDGEEGNWVQTMPEKSYNVVLRLYSPLEPWFDQTWRPGDLVPID